jgi:hypothetical protein
MIIWLDSKIANGKYDHFPGRKYPNLMGHCFPVRTRSVSLVYRKVETAFFV